MWPTQSQCTMYRLYMYRVCVVYVHGELVFVWIDRSHTLKAMTSCRVKPRRLCSSYVTTRTYTSTHSCHPHQKKNETAEAMPVAVLDLVQAGIVPKPYGTQLNPSWWPHDHRTVPILQL